jgi:hypothetical protein
MSSVELDREKKGEGGASLTAAGSPAGIGLVSIREAMVGAQCAGLGCPCLGACVYLYPDS